MRTALERNGEKGYWGELLAQTLQVDQHLAGDVPAIVLAEGYTHTGDKEKAFYWLDRSFEARLFDVNL